MLQCTENRFQKIGETAKRFVGRKILAQDLLVKSAKDFAEVAAGMQIKVFHVSIAEITHLNEFLGLQNIIKNSKKVPDIKKKHFFAIKTRSSRSSLKRSHK